MTDHDPAIRDAFRDDVPLAPGHREQLWTAMQQRQSRQIRRRYLARAGVLLLAGAAIGGVFIIRNSVSRSPSAAATNIPALAADSIPNFSAVEPPMNQDQTRAEVPSNLIPLLGHRSSLSMDVDKYEAQIDALGRRLNTTTGGEHAVVVRQLEDAQHQLQATKAALAAVDRELSGQQGAPAEFSSVAITQSPPIFVSGPAVLPEGALYVAGGVGGGLLLATLALAFYMHRITRSTRHALSLVESQISSQHATLAAGIDAIALEVERLGEGQRFMSRVLSKGESQVRGGEATT